MSNLYPLNQIEPDKLWTRGENISFIFDFHNQSLTFCWGEAAGKTFKSLWVLLKIISQSLPIENVVFINWFLLWKNSSSHDWWDIFVSVTLYPVFVINHNNTKAYQNWDWPREREREKGNFSWDFDELTACIFCVLN